MIYSRALFILLLSTCMILPGPIQNTQFDEKNLIVENELTPLLWNRTYGGEENDSGYDIIAVSGGGFAVTGITDHPEGCVWLLRTDSEGNSLWNQTYDVGTQGISLIEVDSGGFAIATADGWLIRTDTDGAVLWNRTYTNEVEDIHFSTLLETRAGDFAIIGYQPGQNYDLSFWLIDSSGDIINWRTFSGPRDLMDGTWGIDRGYDIIEHSTGGFAISASLDGKMALVRLDVSGNHLWRRIFSAEYSGYGTSLVEVSQGSMLLAGVVNGDAQVIKTDSNGDVIWQERYGAVDEDVHMVLRNDESFALAGTRNDSMWITRIAANGTKIWEQRLSMTDQVSMAHSIIDVSENSLVITGSITSNAPDGPQTQLLIVAFSDVLVYRESSLPTLLSVAAIGLIFTNIAILETLRRRRSRN